MTSTTPAAPPTASATLPEAVGLAVAGAAALVLAAALPVASVSYGLLPGLPAEPEPGARVLLVLLALVLPALTLLAGRGGARTALAVAGTVLAVALVGTAAGLVGVERPGLFGTVTVTWTPHAGLLLLLLGAGCSAAAAVLRLRR